MPALCPRLCVLGPVAQPPARVAPLPASWSTPFLLLLDPSLSSSFIHPLFAEEHPPSFLRERAGSQGVCPFVLSLLFRLLVSVARHKSLPKLKTISSQDFEGVV